MRSDVAAERRSWAREERRDAEGRWPTPHELRVFVGLAETLHFGRAASTLGLAQSSLSEVLRRLEDKLDVVLLERTSRRVSLTAEGARLVPVARTILSDLTAMRSAGGEPDDGRTPSTLRVGVEATGLVELNGPVLGAIADRLPGVRLVVRESLGPDWAFADQNLDVALVRSPVDDSLVVHVVATERRGLLVPPHHPLARRGRGGIRDVLTEPFVAVAGVPRTRDYWLAAEHRDGQAPVVGGTAHTMQEMLDAVGHLGLLTTGCRSMTRSHPFPEVAFVPADDLPPNEIGIALRRSESRPEVLGLVGAVRGIVAEMADEAFGITPTG